MPATRIRGRLPSVVNSNNTSGGSTGNPAGSSLTTDSVGMIEIIQAEAALATPTDAALFDIAFSTSDTNTAPTDASSLLEVVNQTTDTASAPTGAHGTVINAGATTAAATNTAGNGWATPTNAQGVNDGTQATCTSAAGLNAANNAGTLLLTFASIGTPATETVAANPVLTVYAALNVGTLATGTLTLSYSTDGGTNYTQIANLTATNAGPFTVTLTGFSIANLGQLRVRAVASNSGSVTGASTSTVDAAVVVFNTTGSAG